MKKKRVKPILNVVTILSIIFIASVFTFSVLYTKPALTGFTIYQSASDGLTINDTSLRESLPNNNYFELITLRVGNITTGGGTEYRALIQDNNISYIDSGNTIVSAKLQVYVNSSYGQSNITLKAYRVTSAWTENQTTWNDRIISTNWSSLGGDFNAQELDSVNFTNQSGQYYNFSITEAVRGWVNGTYNNYGIILIAPDTAAGNYTYLASINDTNTNHKPRFIIDYTENAAPIITNLSTNSSPTNPIQVGDLVNITIGWSDLEADSGQLFVCNSSGINTSGCNQTTFCNTSFDATSPSFCTYTILSTDNRTTSFWVAVCDSNNCSTINQSYFYMNHLPTPLIIQPNGGETVNQSLGNYSIQFNVTDSDSDFLTADLYYGIEQNSSTNSIISNLNLSDYCTDIDSDTATINNCSYSWNSSGIYGTFYLTAIINDSFSIANDSSNANFDVRSLTDNIAPNITAQWMEDSEIYSGESIEIYANVSDPNVQAVWVSINITSENLTMSNATAGIYNLTWIATTVGNHSFKVYANDTLGNINSSMPWQNFNITKPIASTQNETAPSTALPFHTIKITAQLNATDPLRDVDAYLNIPDGFTFLSDYPQNSPIGNFTANQTKTATWFVSVPITEATYALNVTYTDFYSNEWNSSNFQIQVTSATGSGYDLWITGYPEVETSDNYFAQAEFTQAGTYTNPDSMIIKIYDASGSLIVGPASMTSESTGIYNYSYAIGASVTEGQWETIINATKSSVPYYANHFWKVVGGPFDVRDIVIDNSVASSLQISVTVENTGGANKDITMTWNLSRTDTGTVLDSGSDTVMVPASSEETYTINPSTSYVGQVKITFLGYYSETEKAGAYKTFSTTSGTTPPGDDGGGGGGGGGTVITPKKADFTIVAESTISLTKNIEKTVQLQIENTGAKDLNNILLELENLDPTYYTISPSSIVRLNTGDTEKFDIKFLITDFIGEKDFNYKVKTNEITKTQPGKIIVLSIKEYFLEEIKRLKEKIQETKNQITESQLLTELKECETIVSELELNVEKEEFINAENNVKEADDCIDKVQDKIKIEVPTIKMEYWMWIIALLLLLLLIALIAIAYILYKKFSVMNFIKARQQPTQSINQNIDKKEYLDKKIRNIENKLSGLKK